MEEIKDQEVRETKGVVKDIGEDERSVEKRPKKRRELKGLTGFLEKATKVLIYATIFLLPLVFSPSSFDVLELPKQSFMGITVSLALILWLTKMALSKDFRLKKTSLDIPILIFTGVYLISSLVSVSPVTSLLGFYGRLNTSFLSIIYFVVLYYLIVNNIKTGKEILGVFLSLFMSTILVSVVSILQIFGIYVLPSTVTYFKIFNTVGTLNALSVFLMAMVPLGLSQVIQKNNETRISFIVSTILMFILLILLNVDAAWWGVLTSGLLISGLAYYKKGKDIEVKMLAFPGVIALLSLVFVFYSSFGVNLPKEIVLDKKNATSIATQTVKEKPIFGSGPETFIYDFSKYRPGEMNDSSTWALRFDKARGDWLHTLATTGFLGLLSYGFMIIMAVVIGIRQFTRSSNDKNRFLALGLTGSVVSVAVVGMFYYTNVSLSLVFWVSLALLSILSKKGDDVEVREIKVDKISLEAKVFASVFLVLLFFGSFYSMSYAYRSYSADVKYRKGLEKALTTENLEEPKKLLQDAIDTNGLRESYRFSLARLLLVEANIENQKEEEEKSVEKIQTLLSQAIDEGKAAVNVNPQSVTNWEGMAVIYRNAALYATGALDWIKATYSEAISLEPTNPILVNGLGQAYLSNNETERAKELFTEAIGLKANFADPYFNLALALKDEKDYDAALDMMNKFLELVPGSEEAKKQVQEIEDLKSGKIVPESTDEALRGRPPEVEVEKESVGTEDEIEDEEESEDTENEKETEEEE